MSNSKTAARLAYETLIGPVAAPVPGGSAQSPAHWRRTTRIYRAVDLAFRGGNPVNMGWQLNADGVTIGDVVRLALATR